MNVLLISANTLDKPYHVYPIGLDYVAGAISDEHNVRIVDLNTCPGYTSIVEVIESFRPDVIGISIRNVDTTDLTDANNFTTSYIDLVKILRTHSNAAIVIGGSAFTIFPAEFMEKLDVDYGIIGEGERIGLLLDAIEKGKDPVGIDGVVTKRSIDFDLPSPWPDGFFRRFEPTSPHVDFYKKNGGMLNLQTKRGCIFKCIYCTYPRIEGSRLRRIPPQEVGEMAMRLQDAGAKFIFITDAAFNSDYDHSLEVAEAFKKAGLTIPWGGFFAPTRAPKGYYKSLREAGLTHVEFGTESLCDRTLCTYRKPFHPGHVFEAHEAALDAGLNIAHYFLLGGPGEDPSTVEMTLSNVERLKRSVFFFFLGMRIYPRTPLYDLAIEEGQIKKGQDLLDTVFYRSPSIDSEAIMHIVRARSMGRKNWVIGAGTDIMHRITSRVYRHGFTGPLWEYMIS